MLYLPKTHTNKRNQFISYKNYGFMMQICDTKCKRETKCTLYSDTSRHDYYICIRRLYIQHIHTFRAKQDERQYYYFGNHSDIDTSWK